MSAEPGMDGGAPRVSVVLPTFNRAAVLPVAMRSVLAQSFTDLELIVVDDGSTEDIRGLVQASGDPRVRYLRQERRGVAAARNAGVAAARGAYLAFQDSDDEWLLDKLQRQLEAIAPTDPDHMVLCGLLRVRGRSVSRYPARIPPSGRISHAQVLSYPFAYVQTWLVPRTALLAEGGFDESMRNWSDWEMLIRLSRRLAVHAIAEPLVVSVQLPDSLTVVNPAWIPAMEHILSKHAGHLANDPAAAADLRYAYARLLLAAGRLPDARAVLLRNLVRRPWHWRSAAVAGLSLGGRGLLERALGNPR